MWGACGDGGHAGDRGRAARPAYRTPEQAGRGPLETTQSIPAMAGSPGAGDRGGLGCLGPERDTPGPPCHLCLPPSVEVLPPVEVELVV